MGNRPGSYVRLYSVPRLSQTQNSHRKRGDLIVENFVIVTPVHPEVPPRNWAIHVPKDMEKCGDLDSKWQVVVISCF